MPYTSLPTVNPGEPVASNWGNLVDSNLDWHEAQKVNKTGDTLSGVHVWGSSPSPGGIGTQVGSGGIVARKERSDGFLLVLIRGATQGGAAGDVYVRFMNGPGPNDVQAGFISLVAGPGVNYNTGSDRRMKDEVGPIVDALDRIGRLRPIRHRWKSDPDAGEFDGFIADEVAPVVPAAVTGEPDAVDDDGAMLPQQLDVSRLVPLLVAAVQDLTERLTRLEAGST